MVHHRKGGTAIHVYEVKHADIILDAPFYVAQSQFAALQISTKGILPLTGMAPGYTIGFGATYSINYSLWPTFAWSPPGWILTTWHDYARFPGVILYDWVPDEFGRRIRLLDGLGGGLAAALLIQHLQGLRLAGSAGAIGSEAVNAQNSLRGNPWRAPSALNVMGTVLERLGRTYSVLPVSAPRAFHPKLILQTNEKQGRLIVGSHPRNLVKVAQFADMSIVSPDFVPGFPNGDWNYTLSPRKK